MVSSLDTILYIFSPQRKTAQGGEVKRSGEPIPSFTGTASGEKSTVVILATDGLYLMHTPRNSTVDVTKIRFTTLFWL